MAGPEGADPSTAGTPFSRPAGAAGPFDAVPDRLDPRPTARPEPSAGQQAAFGRPSSVTGGFAGGRPLPPDAPVPPPPPEALLRAFGPSGPSRRGLQDPPGGRPGARRTS